MNFEFRMLDSRIGRFLSRDPLAKQFPWNSPYAFAENKVIQFIELEGGEIKKGENNSDTSTLTVSGSISTGFAFSPITVIGKRPSFWKSFGHGFVQAAKFVVVAAAVVALVTVTGGAGAALVVGEVMAYAGGAMMVKDGLDLATGTDVSQGES